MSGVENPRAFPREGTMWQEGMTLRDYFAGQWLAGCLSGGAKFEGPTGVAEEAYAIADAMLQARGEAPHD